MLVGLERVVVAVHDLDGAAEVYGRLLGREPSRRSEIEDLGLRSAVFRLANTSLQLVSPGSEGALAAPVQRRLSKTGEGIQALTFAVDDTQAAVRYLRGRGIEVQDPMPQQLDLPDGAGRRSWQSVIVPASACRGISLSLLGDADGSIPEASLACDESVSLHALDHVVLQTPDADATARLYGDGLGLRLALDRVFEERGLRILFFRVGGVTLEVVGALPGTSHARDPLRTDVDRFGGLAWQSRDIPAARARLADAGFDVSEHRAGHKPGTRVFTVRSDTCSVPTLVIGPDAG